MHKKIIVLALMIASMVVFLPSRSNAEIVSEKTSVVNTGTGSTGLFFQRDRYQRRDRRWNRRWRNRDNRNNRRYERRNNRRYDRRDRRDRREDRRDRRRNRSNY